MIRKLSMKGWKSHEDTSVDFSKGTNVLVGIMGSGKSSILQAITFGLFGEVPEVRSRKLALLDLIMRKPRRLEKATVSIEFDDEDLIYRVERTLSKKKNDAKLYKEGKIFEVGSRRVTDKVTEILGTDYETFVNVVYARQNDIDNFLKYGKTDRVKLIDSLLRIDRLEEARKKLRSFHTGIKSRLEDLKQLAGKDTSETEDFVKLAESKIQKLDAEFGELQLLVSLTKEKLDIKRLEFKKFDELRKRRDELKSRVSQLKGEIDSLELQLSKLPKIAGASDRLAPLETQLKKLKRDERELINELSSSKSRKVHLEDRVKWLAPHKKLAEKTMVDVSEKLDKTRNDKSLLQAQIESHEQSVNQLGSAGAKCPVCEHSLENPEKHILRHKDAVSKLKLKLVGVEKELKILVAEKTEGDKMKAEIEKSKLLIQELPGIEKELRAINLDSLEKKTELASKAVVELSDKLEQLRKAVEREKAEVTLSKAHEQFQAYQSQLLKTGFNESEYSKLRTTVEELSSSLSGDVSRMQIIPNLIDARRAEVSALNRELGEVNKAKEDAAKTEKRLASLSILTNTIVDVQVLVRQGFIELVNELLGDIWSQLYPYGDYASLRIFVESDGRRAGDYILQLRERLGWVSVDGVASGGERSIASLALRVAFARALSKLGLLLLDEPTHNLDDNGINKLSDVLREGMPNVLNQIVIITHEERMEKASTGSAYRLVRDKELEEPTSIERL
ncbi:MAG: SMC family ATPase [Candidatus Altiarchaeota archaeon]|nr:SMC family ATPase [Candidatus Altiarchaeota archaeon]